MNQSLLLSAGLLLFMAAGNPLSAQSGIEDYSANIVINTDLGEEVISRHIYGHFSEHLGRCIYGGYWVGEDSGIPNTRGIRNDPSHDQHISLKIVRRHNSYFNRRH